MKKIKAIIFFVIIFLSICFLFNFKTILNLNPGAGKNSIIKTSFAQSGNSSNKIQIYKKIFYSPYDGPAFSINDLKHTGWNNCYIVADITFTAPTDGYAVISASGYFNTLNGSGYYNLFEMDTKPISTIDYHFGKQKSSFSPANFAAVYLTAGVHNISWIFGNGMDATIYRYTLIVKFYSKDIAEGGNVTK